MNRIQSSFYLMITIFYCMHFYAGTYEDARTQFKKALCSTQYGLMPEEKYLAFIELYLQKAEIKLAVPQYLKNTPHTIISCEPYFNALCSVHMALFNHSTVPTRSSNSAIEHSVAHLTSTISMIKINEKLSVDVNTEVQDTHKLLEEANKQYYMRLSLHKRLILGLAYWYYWLRGY